MWLVLINVVKGNITLFMSYLHKNICMYLLSLNSIIIMAWSASLLVLEAKESSLLTSKGCDYVIYTYMHYYTHRWREVGRGILIHLVRPPVSPSVDRIESALYVPQCLPNPFQFDPSYQQIAEGVSRVEFLRTFQNSIGLCIFFTKWGYPRVLCSQPDLVFLLLSLRSAATDTQWPCNNRRGRKRIHGSQRPGDWN